MAGEAPPGYSLRRHGHQAGGRAHRAWPPAAAWRSPTAAASIRCGDLIDGARAAPGSCRRRAADGAQALDRRHAEAGRRAGGRRRRARARSRPARACCRPASPRSRASSSAATVVVVRGRGPRAGPRPGRLSAADARASPATRAVRSRPCSATAAATRSIHRDDLVLSELTRIGSEDAMNAQHRTSTTEDAAAIVARARPARARRRRIALALTPAPTAKNNGADAMARGRDPRRRRPTILAANAARHGGRQGRRHSPRCSTGWRSTTRASRPWPRGSRRSPRCPIRSADAGRLDAAQRPRDRRVRVPLGVIGIIYESRPNVTADAGGTVPQVRQRRDPARRLGELRIPRARSSTACVARPARRRPAGGRDPARADHRPRRGRRACCG